MTALEAKAIVLGAVIILAIALWLFVPMIWRRRRRPQARQGPVSMASVADLQDRLNRAREYRRIAAAKWMPPGVLVPVNGDPRQLEFLPLANPDAPPETPLTDWLENWELEPTVAEPSVKEALKAAFDYADSVAAENGGTAGDGTSQEVLEEIAGRTLNKLLGGVTLSHSEMREVTKERAQKLLTEYQEFPKFALLAVATEVGIYAGALWERERRG